MLTPTTDATAPPPADRAGEAKAGARRWLALASALELGLGAVSLLVATVLAGLGAAASGGEVPLGVGYWMLREGPALLLLLAGLAGFAGAAALHRAPSGARGAAWLLALVPLLGLVSLVVDIAGNNILGVLAGLARLPVLVVAWIALQRVRSLG